MGAINDPENPIRGATAGMLLNEGIHQGIRLVKGAGSVHSADPLDAVLASRVSTPEKAVAEPAAANRVPLLDRRATPRGNAPVWTQAQRDAYHAEQLAAQREGLKNWRPGQPTPRLAEPLHPDEIANIFERGATQPFPYETESATSADLSPGGGVEYRHSGLPLTPAALKVGADIWNTALHNPNASIRGEYPDLAAAGEAAIAARANAQHIGQVQTKWVTEGIDPNAADAFLPQLQLDRLNHLVERDPSLRHDPAFLKNLNDLEQRIPDGFASSPEFRTMLERYKASILNQTEPAAAAAGLKPEQFANLPNAYVRLVASRRAPEGTYAEDVGGTGVRVGPRTFLTTAQKASGTGAYTNSLAESVTADALDKIVKARHNEFYRALAKVGTPLANPKAPAPAGMEKVMFDDRANVIDDPASAKITLAFPRDVARYAAHVYSELRRTSKPTTPAGAAARALDRATATAALAVNPAAATTHMATLSNVVGSTPTPGAPLKALAGLVPGGKTATGLTDILSVDRNAPETHALEAKLSAAGALRPEARDVTPDEASVLKNFAIALHEKAGPLAKLTPHELLFGENGVDKRARLVLAKRFIDSETARTGKPPAWSDVAEFVNKKAGNYIAGNSGALVNFLQRSKLSLFARMATARLANAGRMITGDTGMPGVGNRIQGILLGAPGALVGLDLLNYMLSGHHLADNQPGHHADIQYGTDEEGRPEYVKGSFVDPLTSTAVNRTGAGSLLFDKDVRAAARDVANTAISTTTSHPLLRAGIAVTTGHEPYLDSHGDFRKIDRPSLDRGSGELGSRVRTAVTDMTGVGQVLSGNHGGNEGMPPAVASTLRFLLPAITGKGSATSDPDARNRQQVMATFLDERKGELYRAAPQDRDALLKEFLSEVDDSDYSTVAKALAKRDLLRASVMASVPRVRQIRSDARAVPYAR
jgi:hypothetical protein